jgi:hypothetical protein
MAKHKFAGVVGKREAMCGHSMLSLRKVVRFQDADKIPDDILNEECKPEDASQAAARIVREATEDK